MSIPVDIKQNTKEFQAWFETNNKSKNVIFIVIFNFDIINLYIVEFCMNFNY